MSQIAKYTSDTCLNNVTRERVYVKEPLFAWKIQFGFLQQSVKF